MKVTIRQWNAVAAWRWDMPEDDDLCGICRVQFDGTCPGCKYPGEGCPLLSGKCEHTFHKHCIDTWVNSEQGQGKCPMCRQDFRPRTLPTTVPAEIQNQQAARDSTMEVTA